jgi:uncharacterized protein (DUF433 family)
MVAVQTLTFTPSEAAALTELPARRVRKEIESHVIEAASPPRLPFGALVYFRVLQLLGLELAVDDRARMARRLLEAVQTSLDIDAIELGQVLTLHVGAVVKSLRDKTQQFERWKERLVRSAAIMGGEPVFPKSRLSVRRVGGLLERGERASTILEDYPYLTADDLEMARLFVRAYPRVGRPPATATAD